jgi:hypothetical protein
MPELGFDLNSYEAQQGFTPPPPGDYTAAIESADIQPTANNTGKVMKLSVQIIEGPHQGKSLLHFLNIVNPSDKAEKIARQELAAIVEACGKPKSIQRTEELYGLPVRITVGIEKDNKGVDRARIQRFSAYRPRSTAAPVASSPAAQSQSAANGDGSPPWNS